MSSSVPAHSRSVVKTVGTGKNGPVRYEDVHHESAGRAVPRCFRFNNFLLDHQRIFTCSTVVLGPAPGSCRPSSEGAPPFHWSHLRAWHAIARPGRVPVRAVHSCAQRGCKDPTSR